MRLNEHIAVSTSKVLLVPYDARHVPRYHEWMEDPAIREATASERLSLAEEYANQAEWRAARDKLTFIVCEPLASPSPSPFPSSESKSESQGTGEGEGVGVEVEVVRAGEADEPGRMVGDVNLFLTPWDGEEEDGDVEQEKGETTEIYCTAEIDIMIADPRHRGKGFGRAAVASFLLFIRRHMEGVLAEYASADTQRVSAGDASDKQGSAKPVLKELVAKINESNKGSIALFKSLGFRQRGGVNYFGEVLMVLDGFGKMGTEVAWGESVLGGGYRELAYDRSPE